MIVTGRPTRRSACARCFIRTPSTVAVSRAVTVTRDSFARFGCCMVSTQLFWLSSNDTSSVAVSVPVAVGGSLSRGPIGCSLVLWEAYRTRSNARPPLPPA